MKIKKVYAALTAALCTSSIISYVPAMTEKTYAAEIVSNTFETTYDGWYNNTDATDFEVIPGIGENGSRGMKITGRTSGEDGLSSSKGLYLEGGVDYNYSVKVYSESAQAFKMTLLYIDENTGEETTVVLDEKNVPAGQWTELSANYKAPKHTYEYNLTITSDSTEDFTIDNLLITTKKAQSVKAAPAGKGLKDEFADYFRVGNILNGGTVTNSAITARLLKDCNAIECENETKPDATLVKDGSSNTNIKVSLRSCAAIADFCANNGLGFRGHTLVWHSQTPEWFFKENFNQYGNWVSKDVMNQRMESYIKNMFDAFKTQYPSLDLYAYDVCNECVSDDGNRTANAGGAREPGYGDGKSPWVQVYGDNSFVEQAFIYANEYAPDTCKLYYNDYNEYWDHKRDCIYNMCKSLYSKGLLDGVGMQSHVPANATGFAGTDSYIEAMHKYLSIGCDLQITELDISVENGKYSYDDQAKKYAAIFKAAKDWNENPQSTGRVTLVQVWGPDDAHSWLKSGSNGLMYDANGNAKAAYSAVTALVPDSEWGDGKNYSGGEIKPIEPNEYGWYFQCGFEGSLDNWETRGAGEILTSGRTAYVGSESLLVKDRTSAWQGAAIPLNPRAFKPGEEYSFSANVSYFDGGDTDQFYMKLQYVDGSGKTNYSTIAEGTGVKGEWMQLANTNYKIPEDATDMKLYIETAETTNNFYIDEVIGAVAGTGIQGAGQPKVRKLLKGDVDCDGRITAFDLAEARSGISDGFVDDIAKRAADVDGSLKTNINDIVLLSEYLLGKIDEFPQAEIEIDIDKLQSAFNGVTIASSWKKDGENNPMTTQRFGADPGWMVYDGRLYIYTTDDQYEYYNDGRLMVNTYNSGTINCVSTADMVNWTDHGAMPIAGRNGRTKNGCASWASAAWAPDACWKMIDGKPKFYLFFANSGGGIGVVMSDSPTGPWVDANGGALLTHNSPNCSDVEWMFDPGVYYDETTDSCYLFFGGGRKNGIPAATPGTGRVVKVNLGKDKVTLAGNPVKMDIPYLFEDSSVIKIGDTWYYSYCSNWDVGNQTINGVNFGSADIVYMTSKDPLSWNTSNFAGNVFKNTGAQRIDNGGNNHHSIIYFKGKYYVAYHSRQQAMREFQEKGLVAYEKDGKTNKSDGNYRSTQINEATFSNGKITCSGDMKGCSQIEALDPYEKVQAETMSNQSKGIEVEGLMDTTVVGGKGEWIKVTGASFEKGASKITARASSKNGAVIKVSKGDAKGEVITYIEVPAGGTMTELTSPVLTTLTGSTDICFEFSGDVTFDYWSFM